MPVVNRSALVMYSCQQMYDLVNDIEKYPEFLPNCSDAKSTTNADNTVDGAVNISKAGISKWFTTKNTLSPAQSVSMELIDGPFKYLTGQWQFHKLDESACKVELTVDFEFSSKVVELAFGKLFNSLVTNMVTSFTSRAKTVYG